jgi:hypothetical protein
LEALGCSYPPPYALFRNGPNKARPNKSSPTKCLARSGPPLDSDSVGLSGPKQIGLPLGLGPPGPKQIGLSLGLGLPGPKQIMLFLGLGLSGPKQANRAPPCSLDLGLGLSDPRPDRAHKSAPLESDSGLDSGSVRFLGQHWMTSRGRA